MSEPLSISTRSPAVRSLATVCAAWAILLLALPQARAGAIATTLSLAKVGAASTFTDSIPAGTATYNLELRVNTFGTPVSGLQYYLQTSPANAVTFAATPVVALNSPFTASDLFAGPTSGATVNQAGGTTIWFKGSAGDYPAIAGSAIARYSINTAGLGAGTYTITPVGEELTNAGGSQTAFSTPQSFSLIIVPVPEPGAAGLFALGAFALAARRRRRPCGVSRSA